MTPDEITVRKAHQLANGNQPTWLEEARLYVGTHEDLDGDVDHWQGGAGFNGPKPSRNDSARDSYMDALEEVFVVEDLISEVIERRKNAILGQPPEIAVMKEEGSEDDDEGEGDEGEDAESEATPAERAESLLSDWWEAEELTDQWEEVLTRVSSEEEVLLRLVVGQRIIGEDGTVTAETVEEALSAIRVEIIPRDQGLVHEDIRTKVETGVIAFRKSEESDTGEVDYVEKTYVNDDGETVLQIEYEEGTELPEGVSAVQEESYDLGGNLMHYEVEDNLLVSESVRSNQKTLNTTRTMINITGQKAGFPELHLVNIQPPEDGDGNEIDPERGPSKIQYHVSVPKKAQGPQGQTQERQGTAEVVETDPVDNKSLREDADLARRSIYRSAQQLHVFLSDGTASGVSRVQARHDHVADVEDVAETLDRAGKWALETAYALAAALAGGVGSDLLAPGEASVELHLNVDPGPVTPEMKKEIRSASKEGFLSRKTALLLYGVDHPEEEIQRLREEEDRRRGRDADVLGQMVSEAGSREDTRQSIEEEAGTEGE